MSHEIRERDNLFTVRDPAWHGLGEVLPGYPTREEAQKIAHPWEPVTEPVYRKVPVIVHKKFNCSLDCAIPDHFEERHGYKEITESRLVARSDDSQPLGVVSDTFTVVSNNDLWDIAEAIEGNDPSQVRYETAGSLKNGRKVWVLIRLNAPLLVPGDPHGETIPYYALQNSHDGSGSCRGQSLMTRIVCDNTSQIADMEAQARGTEFVFRHTKSIADRIEDAKQALAGWRASVDAYQDFVTHLAETPVSTEQVDLFVERFIPEPPPHMASDRVMANVAEARQAIHDILESVTCDGINRTAHGLVQAAIEYSEHHRRARSAETRFQRAYLDRSTIVADAVALAQKVAVLS